MKLKFKNNLINYGFVTLLILIVAAMVVVNVKDYQSVQLVKAEMQKYGESLTVARVKALAGERFKEFEQIPFAYGLYFNNDEQSLVVCADMNGDFDCVLSEFVQTEKLSDQIKVNEFHTINFLKYKTVDGVCLDDNCDLGGELLVAEFARKDKPEIISQMFYDADNSRFVIE
ncbi:TPA: hypothetical protein DF272_02325 [Candidatus Falkowbacteria bacterium]|nr:hypothetical protein [Candidatus Falkowbacteria bacterium]